MRSFCFGTMIAATVVGCAQPPAEWEPQRSIGSPELTFFDSCDDLLGRLRENLKEEVRSQLAQEQPQVFLAEDSATGGPVPAMADSSGAAGRGVEFSGTNNQEAGVDEADIVKVTRDGQNMLVLTGDRLKVLGIPEVGEITSVGELPIEGWPSAMLVAGDSVAVFSNIWTYELPSTHPVVDRVQVADSVPYWRTQSLTKISVVSLERPDAPRVTREVFIEGTYQTARMVKGTVRSVSHGRMNLPGIKYWPDLPERYWELPYDSELAAAIFRSAANKTADENDRLIDTFTLDQFLPSLYGRDGSGALSRHRLDTQQCQNFSIPGDGFGRSFTSILTLDLFGNRLGIDADHVVTNRPTVYASTDRLVLAEPAQNYWWFYGAETLEPTTNVHVFDARPERRTHYLGSGRIKGEVRNQFSLSEHDGLIRAATTTGLFWAWWAPVDRELNNHVFVLERRGRNYQSVGHLGGLAPGEQIWSARFEQDRAFLVTARVIDPLFTIDLARPRHPRLVGELKIPGVSTYIHPIERDRLLTVGYAGDDTGITWETQISLFDVSNFEHPRLADAWQEPPTRTSGWEHSWSEALHEHKAFQYWGPMTLLGIPMSVSRYDDTTGYQYISKLQLVSVAKHSLASYGAISHSRFFNESEHRWYLNPEIRRAVFFGDRETGSIYAISAAAVTAHRASDLEQTAGVRLGIPTGPYYDAD